MLACWQIGPMHRSWWFAEIYTTAQHFSVGNCLLGLGNVVVPWIFGWNPPPNFQRALMILLGWFFPSCGLIRMMIHYVLQPFTSFFFLKPQPCCWGPTKWPWDSHTSLTRGWWRETLQSRKDGHALCSRRGQVPWLDGRMVCSGL